MTDTWTRTKTKTGTKTRMPGVSENVSFDFFRLARGDNGNASNVVWAWAAARGAFRANALKHHRASFNHY